jgi:hypothetical protein
MVREIIKLNKKAMKIFKLGERENSLKILIAAEKKIESLR